MSLHTESDLREEQSTDMPAIWVKGVSVRYRVPLERIPSIKEYIIRRLKGEVQYQAFLALKNVDLKVYPGEVVGIIGPNGAGKSTLLKVVARVLRPTQGRVKSLESQVKSPAILKGSGCAMHVKIAYRYPDASETKLDFNNDYVF